MRKALITKLDDLFSSLSDNDKKTPHHFSARDARTNPSPASSLILPTASRYSARDLKIYNPSWHCL
jgi:hypothetical protein